ncbi:myosin light chain 5 isoform X1 [Gorilla gorilla gorilla]|uniref:myosin light chain 5 isoform X1 n=1 Tax=Gorilla gorilla gorilla TaxID=9595 RepID=UPI00300AF551
MGGPRALGGGCKAWITLMSGETCTGGTILSLTSAPEAQPADRGGCRTSPQSLAGKGGAGRTHAPSAARERGGPRPLATGRVTARPRAAVTSREAHAHKGWGVRGGPSAAPAQLLREAGSAPSGWGVSFPRRAGGPLFPRAAAEAPPSASWPCVHTPDCGPGRTLSSCAERPRPEGARSKLQPSLGLLLAEEAAGAHWIHKAQNHLGPPQAPPFRQGRRPQGVAAGV